ncbi:MAG TPA: fatty acid desaturase [Anaerolineae bacterium]|nr:fatty acid desaturase [Anaerolineae bacterium]
MSDLDRLNWQALVAPYTTPEVRRSVWQVINSVGPVIALWAGMYWSLSVSYVLTLALAIPTAGFLVRTFIIFHDCCHGSFFKSRRANDTLGVILGILTFTPYYHWRHDHAIHHATAGNLDKRGVGDVPVMTVVEYLAAPWWRRAGYRFLRNPLMLFTVGAPFMFLVVQRFAAPHSGKRERLSVVYTNLALLALFGGLSVLLGWREVALVQLPVTVITSVAGVWLFYVQHQFEGVYWERKDSWNFARAGFEGSSFYKLPAVLQWFTGNIGFHHIHHLSPKVPNYLLPKCHYENQALQIEPLTLWSSFKSARLHLYDEATQMLVGFNSLKRYKKSTAQ